MVWVLLFPAGDTSVTGVPAIYAAQQEYMSTVENKSKVTKRRQNQYDAHRVTSMINRLSSELNERSKVDELSLYSDGIEVRLV